METILITGGTGLIGTALTSFLTSKGYNVIVLTRQASKHQPAERLRFAEWDPRNMEIDQAAMMEADHIIHLAGAGVADKRWSTKRKKEIRDSRVNGCELLVKSLRENPHKVKTVVSASAIGWYGPDPKIPNENAFTEEVPAAEDNFLGKTCLDWENAIRPVEDLGIRLVVIRTGIVLSEKGGALKEFVKPMKFGIATILGSGTQVLSWIHINDLVRVYCRSIEQADLTGVFNAVAPNPVNNKTLVLSLAKQRKGSAFIAIHVPQFALKLALGEMSIEVLKSATVSSEKLRQTGFQFVYPTIESI